MENLNLQQVEEALLALELFQTGILFKIFRDEAEEEIIQTASAITSIVPDSIQAFFGREQAVGKNAQQITNFDLFANLRGSLLEQKQQLTQKDNDND